MSPKRWRLNRAQRLRAAPKFFAGYTGKDLVRGYRQWFRIDRLCAMLELNALGVAIPESDIERQKVAIAAKARARVRQDADTEADYLMASSPHSLFAVIAGYTSGGAPYGITWEEMENFPSLEGGGDDPLCEDYDHLCDGDGPVCDDDDLFCGAEAPLGDDYDPFSDD
jgi:hypothetical protein